jgi:hypothetical protein
MNEGRLVGELHRNDFSQEAVMKFIMDDYENRKGRIA